MAPIPAPRLKTAFVLASLLALAGCGSLGSMFPASRSGDVPSRPPNDPPVTEARICDLARQAVRQAMGVAALRGEQCTASHARPGEWQARVDFVSGTQQQS